MPALTGDLKVEVALTTAALLVTSGLIPLLRDWYTRRQASHDAEHADGARTRELLNAALADRDRYRELYFDEKRQRISDFTAHSADVAELTTKYLAQLAQLVHDRDVAETKLLHVLATADRRHGARAVPFPLLPPNEVPDADVPDPD